jgi:hypothetical protein
LLGGAHAEHFAGDLLLADGWVTVSTDAEGPHGGQELSFPASRVAFVRWGLAAPATHMQAWERELSARFGRVVAADPPPRDPTKAGY